MGAIVGSIQSRSLIATVELGIANALTDGPVPIEEIAARTGTDSDFLFRLRAGDSSWKT